MIIQKHSLLTDLMYELYDSTDTQQKKSYKRNQKKLILKTIHGETSKQHICK